MSQLNDNIHAALTGLGFTGQINDQMLAYYQANGATSGQINDAEVEWLKLQIVAPLEGEQLNDLWFQYLRELGHTGALNDMQTAYWASLIP